MSGERIVVGIDGSETGGRALEYAKHQARVAGNCTLTLVYVIEWSPYSFQTQEENAMRHQRRKEEIEVATERFLDPAVVKAREEGFDATGEVRHGEAADILEDIAGEVGAGQIVVGRVGQRGLKARFFGSVAGRLATSSPVPVTIVP